MPKFKRVDLHGEFHAVTFKCPGCGMSHTLYTQDTPAARVGPRWDFNGNWDRPTLTPSILARGAFKPDEPDEDKDWDGDAICHSFVTDGSIQFLADCTHALASQTVPLPEIGV